VSSSINRLFVVYKPAGIGSNRYLSRIKREFKVKKAGFSGTLDPFAKGVLIIAFGQYTKLFQFLKKAPKKYRATLWLGAYSDTLDIEKVSQINQIKKLDLSDIKKAISSLKGDIRYLPPKYSAKKIDGKRAYELARGDVEFELKSITSTIYDINFIHYTHPFVTFDITISEGGYIRSIAQIITKKLDCIGTLSALERVSEGEFIYDDKRELNPLEYLDLKENFYLKNIEDLLLGKKLKVDDFKESKDGDYFINLDTMMAVITIEGDKVTYRLNGVKLC
jgi:tRNA pseudouridine55 synthase